MTMNDMITQIKKHLQNSRTIIWENQILREPSLIKKIGFADILGYSNENSPQQAAGYQPQLRNEEQAAVYVSRV